MLIRVQGAETGIGVGFSGVKLLLGDLALFHQRGVALQIGLGELGVGAAAIDVGLGKGEVRGLRLLIGSLRAKEIGLRSGELRIRTGLAAGDIFAGARYIHTRNALRLPPEPARPWPDRRRPDNPRVESGRAPGLFHGLIVLHEDFANAARDFSSNGGDVAVNLGVVGGFAIVE